jgi:WD40 repeat protein
MRHDNRGTVKVVGAALPTRPLTREWAAAGGIAWSPNGEEVWFTASQNGAPKSLWAATLKGAVRPLTAAAGELTLRDVAPDGRALASRDTQQLEMAAVLDGEPAQRNLSWLDWSRAADISDNGRVVLFDESGVGAGSQYLVYIHRFDDGSTTRLGPGLAMAFAPDGRSVLTRDAEDLTRLRLIPIGEGKTEDLPATGLEYQWVRYFPRGDRLLALANEPGRPLRLFVQPVRGKPSPVTPPGTVRNVAISPDGTRIALLSSDGKLIIYPLSGSAGQVVPTERPLAPLLWTKDDWLYVQQMGAYTQIPTRLSRMHLTTGRIEFYRELMPGDLLGVNAITKVLISRDTRAIVFNYRRVLSELFVAERPSR